MNLQYMPVIIAICSFITNIQATIIQLGLILDQHIPSRLHGNRPLHKM